MAALGIPSAALVREIAEGTVGQERGDGLGNLTNHILWDPGTFLSPLAAIVHPCWLTFVSLPSWHDVGVLSDLA